MYGGETLYAHLKERRLKSRWFRSMAFGKVYVVRMNMEKEKKNLEPRCVWVIHPNYEKSLHLHQTPCKAIPLVPIISVIADLPLIYKGMTSWITD